MNLTEVVIDSDTLRHNLRAVRALAAPKSQIAAVIKGNAYGHGLELVVRCLEGQVDYFQVDHLDELKRLRSVSQTPALVLGYLAPWEMEEALGLGCELGIFDLEYAHHVVAAAQAVHTQVKVHLKVDALLGRLGVLPTEFAPLANFVNHSPELEPVGIYAHFANIEDTTDLNHAQAQRSILNQCEAHLRQLGMITKSHISATSGLMAMEPGEPKSLVRVGVGLYGMYPSLPLSRSHASLALQPVLSWNTRLAQVKELPPKHPVGYGLTYVTSSRQRIGIVPQGYSDGYDRGLSNSGEVLVHGVRCAVLGRIAMNMFAVDLTQVDEAKAGDLVTLIGPQGNDRIYAEELATRIGTINYEVTSRICPLLYRRATHSFGPPQEKPAL